MAKVFIRHMAAETRVRGAERLAFAEGAGTVAWVRTARARQGLAARVKQRIMSVFMYTEYTVNTPEGVVQGFFCYKCHHLCAPPLAGGPRWGKRVYLPPAGACRKR